LQSVANPPVHRRHYTDDFRNAAAVKSGLEVLAPDDWIVYRRAGIVANTNPRCTRGTLTAVARKPRAGDRL
jgi:hypothetical protein